MRVASFFVGESNKVQIREQKKTTRQFQFDQISSTINTNPNKSFYEIKSQKQFDSANYISCCISRGCASRAAPAPQVVDLQGLTGSVVWFVRQVIEVVVGIPIAQLGGGVGSLSLLDAVEVIDEAFAGLTRKH